MAMWWPYLHVEPAVTASGAVMLLHQGRSHSARVAVKKRASVHAGLVDDAIHVPQCKFSLGGLSDGVTSGRATCMRNRIGRRR